MAFMKRVSLIAWCMVGALLTGCVAAAELKSGPQPGDSVGAFHPLNVTGPFAGQKQCLV
jgi:hypothetical protein